MGFLKSTLAAGATVSTHLVFSLGFVTPELIKLICKGTVISAKCLEKIAQSMAKNARSGESLMNMLIFAMEQKEESICNRIKQWSLEGREPSDVELQALIEDLVKFNMEKS